MNGFYQVKAYTNKSKQIKGYVVVNVDGHIRLGYWKTLAEARQSAMDLNRFQNNERRMLLASVRKDINNGAI